MTSAIPVQRFTYWELINMLGPNIPSKWWIMILDIRNSYICTAVKKRMQEILAAKNTNISVVPCLHYTCTKGRPQWVFRSGMKTPNKLIQKWLVSKEFYPGIMWQPGWTRFWTKLTPISCKRSLKVFIPRASRFALLSLNAINFNSVEATTRL